jgi:hypothetical protein
MTDADPSSEPLEYHCPNCNQVLRSPESQGGTVTCPQCGQEVVVDSQADVRLADMAPECQSETPPPSDDSDEADLSGLKIRQISDLRRGAHRSRSWLIIGAVACLVGAAQLIYFAIHNHGLGMRAAALEDTLFVVLALAFCVYFLRRAREMNREISNSKLEEPTTPPDFSSLRDGSQRWKNLEDLANRTDEN